MLNHHPELQIKFFRQRANLSRAQLAMLLDIDCDTLRAYEDGTKEPSMAEVIKICEICKVSSDEMFNMQPDM